jgi:hypothetical protein
MCVHPYVCASNRRWFDSMAYSEHTTGTHFASRDRVPRGKAGKPLGTATVSSSAAVPVRSSGSTGTGFSNASSGSRDPKDVARFCGQNTRRQGGVDTAAMPTTTRNPRSTRDCNACNHKVCATQETGGRKHSRPNRERRRAQGQGERGGDTSRCISAVHPHPRHAG